MNPSLRITLWLALALTACCSIACAKKKVPDPRLWEIQPPVTRVLSLNVTEQSDNGFRVEAVVELENTNRVQLPLQDTRYTIEIQQVGSISLEDDAQLTIPAHGKQKLILPASFAWDKPAVGGLKWRVHGNVEYRPPGELRQILTETSIPLPSASFTGHGIIQ